MPTIKCPACESGIVVIDGLHTTCQQCHGEGTIIAPFTPAQRGSLMLFLKLSYPEGANQRRPGMTDGELAWAVQSALDDWSDLPVGQVIGDK